MVAERITDRASVYSLHGKKSSPKINSLCSVSRSPLSRSELIDSIHVIQSNPRVCDAEREGGRSRFAIQLSIVVIRVTPGVISTLRYTPFSCAPPVPTTLQTCAHIAHSRFAGCSATLFLNCRICILRRICHANADSNLLMFRI